MNANVQKDSFDDFHGGFTFTIIGMCFRSPFFKQLSNLQAFGDPASSDLIQKSRDTINWMTKTLLTV